MLLLDAYGGNVRILTRARIAPARTLAPQSKGPNIPPSPEARVNQNGTMESFGRARAEFADFRRAYVCQGPLRPKSGVGGCGHPGVSQQIQSIRFCSGCRSIAIKVRHALIKRLDLVPDRLGYRTSHSCIEADF